MKIKEITITAIFSAVLCVLSVISVPIGAIPVSLATFGVMIIGSFLNIKCAVVSVLVYIMLGCVGLPVFSSFGSGLGVILGANGGYIMAYPLMSAVIAAIAQKNKKHRKSTLLFSYIISHLICYLFGAAWYSIVAQVPFYTAVSVAAIPFILADSVKIFTAFIITTAAKKGIFN